MLMKKSLNHLIFLMVLVTCQVGCSQPKSSFDEDATIPDVSMEAISGEKITLRDVLARYKGQTVLIDFWASWCGDCIESFQYLKDYKAKNPQNIVFLYVNVDQERSRWLDAIETYDLKGDHLYLPEGMKGNLGQYIGLTWIPRFMVINPKGEIALWKATQADDKGLSSYFE
ncbi:MAG TPA: alkyl hydroperoxide reductase [Bacteroidetes bacterium]|nr:alkyl hydroperoxide reductase [Bacteroidota bacterium]|tara:strand:- start:7 stop:519 length:513 start_codon:yes stop_codon:yes gene_type:complete